MRVMIAACDTFRSGAVEQLRTHKSRLAALHPPDREGGPCKVMLFERGYGKDAAGIAMDAINYGEDKWGRGGWESIKRTSFYCSASVTSLFSSPTEI